MESEVNTIRDLEVIALDFMTSLYQSTGDGKANNEIEIVGEPNYIKGKQFIALILSFSFKFPDVDAREKFMTYLNEETERLKINTNIKKGVSEEYKQAIFITFSYDEVPYNQSSLIIHKLNRTDKEV